MLSTTRVALLFATLISPTDPVATLAILRQVRAPPLLHDVIFGEATLNDALSIVIFNVVRRHVRAPPHHACGEALVDRKAAAHAAKRPTPAGARRLVRRAPSLVPPPLRPRARWPSLSARDTASWDGLQAPRGLRACGA